MNHLEPKDYPLDFYYHRTSSATYREYSLSVQGDSYDASIAGIEEKGNNYTTTFFGNPTSPSHSFFREIAFSAASCSHFFLLDPFTCPRRCSPRDAMMI
jgi:hypothetical protein